MLATVAANRPHWTDIQGDDAYVQIAQRIGGDVLHGIVLVASICSIAGMFMAELFCESFLVCGMGDYALIPGFFQR